MKNQILQFFEFQHLPKYLQTPALLIWGVAVAMDHILPDGPEKSAGLRKLLEAKDCFVRALLFDCGANEEAKKSG